MKALLTNKCFCTSSIHFWYCFLLETKRQSCSTTLFGHGESKQSFLGLGLPQHCSFGPNWVSTSWFRFWRRRSDWNIIFSSCTAWWIPTVNSHYEGTPLLAQNLISHNPISQTNLFGSSACSAIASDVWRSGGASGGNIGAAIGSAGGGNGGGNAVVLNCIPHEGRGMLSHRGNEEETCPSGSPGGWDSSGSGISMIIHLIYLYKHECLRISVELTTTFIFIPTTYVSILLHVFIYNLRIIIFCTFQTSFLLAQISSLPTPITFDRTLNSAVAGEDTKNTAHKQSL